MHTLFQHTAARRRLIPGIKRMHIGGDVSTHSRPKAAEAPRLKDRFSYNVSTHSRPKAAEFHAICSFFRYARFNTQPPEGG